MVLLALVLLAPVLLALVLLAQVLAKAKASTLFCREFENVVIHAFLVLLFWAKTAAGATVFAFCNYGPR